MTSDVSPPNRPSRRTVKTPRFSPPMRILWWLGALLPSIVLLIEYAAPATFSGYRFVTPLNTLAVSVIVCSAASYSQRRGLEAQLIDFSLVMLLSLAQITLIHALVYLRFISPSITP